MKPKERENMFFKNGLVLGILLGIMIFAAINSLI